MSMDREQQQEQQPSFFKSKLGMACMAAGVIVVAGSAFFAFSGTADGDESPSPVATASMGTVDTSSTASPGPSGGPSAGAESPGGSTEAPEASSPSQGPASGVVMGPSVQEAVPVEGPIRVGDAPQAPIAGDWRPAAEGFAPAWANPGVGHEEWLAGMKPYITEDMYRSFSYTDINVVPQLEVRSVILYEDGPRFTDVKIVYEDGYSNLARLTIQNDGSWLVSNLVPYED